MWECCALPLSTVRPPVLLAVTSPAVPLNSLKAMEGSAFIVELGLSYCLSKVMQIYEKSD